MGMGKLCAIKSVKTTQKTTLASILLNKPPWARYSASSWSGTTLSDLTGNARHATTSGVALGSTTGNGCSGTITSIGGTTTTTIAFPTGSIPTTFTIASLSRYGTTGSTNRVLCNNSTTGNIFHGHQGAKRGVSYYDNGWKTAQATVGTLRNWLNCVGTNGSGVSIPSNIVVDGTGIGVANAGIGNYTLAINIGRSAEYSDYELSQLIIWDQALTADEMTIVANAITNYMNTGILQ